jgi:hypothetical protein
VVHRTAERHPYRRDEAPGASGPPSRRDEEFVEMSNLRSTLLRGSPALLSTVETQTSGGKHVRFAGTLVTDTVGAVYELIARTQDQHLVRRMTFDLRGLTEIDDDGLRAVRAAHVMMSCSDGMLCIVPGPVWNRWAKLSPDIERDLILCSDHA